MSIFARTCGLLTLKPFYKENLETKITPANPQTSGSSAQSFDSLIAITLKNKGGEQEMHSSKEQVWRQMTKLMRDVTLVNHSTA